MYTIYYLTTSGNAGHYGASLSVNNPYKAQFREVALVGLATTVLAAFTLTDLGLHYQGGGHPLQKPIRCNIPINGHVIM